MRLDKKYFYDSLQKQYYAYVPFLIEDKVYEDAMQAFFKFLDTPDNIKNHIDFKITDVHRRGDIGFKHRDPANDIYNDSKDFFHFHPAIFDKYPEFVENTPVVKDFMLKALPIWQLTYETICSILEIFDQDFPGISDSFFKTQYPHVMLRFLKYNWQESGENLAKPHFDSGSLTLAISESSPGLRIGSCPEDLQIVEHKDNQAIFMLSSNFRKVMDTDEFKPGWHDVIQLDKTLIGRPFARYAIVAFIEADGVEALSREETHKWYVAAN